MAKTPKNIKAIMKVVDEYESSEKSEFIKDLLFILQEDVVDNVQYCLEMGYPLGTDL